MVHVYVYPPRTGLRLSRSKYGPANRCVAFSGKFSLSHFFPRLPDGFPIASATEEKEGNRHGD